MADIEILRGYELLSDNTVQFGIRVTNHSDTVITDVEVILDYPESLFKLQGDRIQKLGNILPNVSRTAKFVLKPMSCVHKEHVEADVKYRDSKGEKHICTMRPKEIDCVCPFLRAKPLTKSEFLELASISHVVDTGINFQGISKDQLTSFLKQTCASRFHKVDEYSIDDNNVFYLSSESVGEKAYYLLTVLIKEQDGLTQIMLRAVSDKTHGINGFLNEIVSELKHFVNTVKSAKEIGVIRNEQVINIIDSVVQRTSFSMKDSLGSINIKDSVVQRSEIEASPSSVNIRDSVVQHTSIKANDEKKKDERSASTQMKRTNVPTTETKNSRKFMFIPVVIIIVLAGYWMFSTLLEDNSNNQDTVVPKSTEVVNSSLAATETTPLVMDDITTTFPGPREGDKTYTNSIDMEFVLIPAGTFEMGSNNGGDEETPVHEVTIGQAYYLGKYEVTQEQWVKMMGSNPSTFEGDSNPVEQVSWFDVSNFVEKLNEVEGTDKYRLPSEAEWEYACRAGTITEYSFGNDESKLGDYAWYSENSGDKTHPVGQKKPNPWGLYDMHGNVWEWVQDRHDTYENTPVDGSAWEGGFGSGRVVRGGCWFGYAAGECRSAFRISIGFDPDIGHDDLGFRLLMEA